MSNERKVAPLERSGSSRLALEKHAKKVGGVADTVGNIITDMHSGTRVQQLKKTDALVKQASESGLMPGPSSEVIQDVGDWANFGILVPHEPLRLDMAEMQKCLAVEHFDGTCEWKVENFFKWYKERFCFIVHHHHDIEEKVYFPFLSSRVEFPEKVAADHPTLMKLLDEIADMEDEFEDVDDDDAKRKSADKLRDLVKNMADQMKAHLKEEEELIPALLRENFTHEEESALVEEKILKPLGLEGNRIMLPWICHAMDRWAGPKITQQFLLQVPGPLRYLYNNYWITDYKLNNWDLLHTLQKKDTDKPRPPKKRGCSIFTWWE